MLSAAYARMSSVRRAWYEGRPHLRRRLRCPVVSVGNLSVGGSGKTPVVAALARLLVERGERPAILSRGYGRRGDDGVVVVSDGDAVLAPVRSSGDEPQMLARSLPGVPVLACADRYLAGRLAERRFGATVAILDDGFQHLQLHRDVDLLLANDADLRDAPLPAGRLREPLDAARRADALVVAGPPDEAARVREALGVGRVFTSARLHEPPRLVQPFGAACPLSPGAGVVAFSGIARPERFFTDLERHGWEVRGRVEFPDHHWYRPADLAKVAALAASVDAPAVLTTEKDAARLGDGPALPGGVTWAFVPMRVALEPAAELAGWLEERLAAARRAPSPL